MKRSVLLGNIANSLKLFTKENIFFTKKTPKVGVKPSKNVVSLQ